MAVKKTHSGRGIAMVTRTTRAIADGEIADLSDGDDDELMYGRRRDRNGQLRGKPPKLIPMRLLQEYNRRAGRRTMLLLMRHLEPAARTIIEIAEKKKAKPGDIVRLKAAINILDRLIGAPPQSLTIASDDELIQPWMKLMARSNVSTADELKDEDIEEGEVVEERPSKRHKAKRLR